MLILTRLGQIALAILLRPIGTLFRLMWIGLIVVAVGWWWSQPYASSPRSAVIAVPEAPALIRGAGEAKDGDSLYVVSGRGRAEIRLWGVDAPEWNEKGGAGRRAKEHLARLIDGRRLTCEPRGTSYQRIVALCRIENDPARDVAALMVRAGHAHDWPKFSNGYYAAEAAR